MLLKIFLFLLFPFTALAAGDFKTTTEILASMTPIDTTCATTAFANALHENSDTISEDDSESDVRQWVYGVMMSPDTLADVLSCPEVDNADDDDTLRFMPKYTFPNGREIVITYATQPKVLEQRFLLANKTELPTNDPNPELSPDDPNATWVNTDPAWYGIMVVQSGALDNFVGPTKNNVVSQQYIVDNIDSIYPKNSDGWCSTKTGIGAKINNSMVHNVIREYTAKHDGDKNNYYIAGDRDLRWIAGAEIAAEVIMAIATMGASAAATGGLKMARAGRIITKISKNMRRLARIDSVKDYVRTSVQVAKYTNQIDRMNDMAKSIRNVDKLEKSLANTAKGTKKYDRILKRLDAAKKLKLENARKLGTAGNGIDKVEDIQKLEKMIEENGKAAEEARKIMAEMAKNPDVAEYVKQFDTLKDVTKYVKELKSIKKTRTGNVFSRTWQGIKNTGKSIKAANTGGKTLDKAAKVARRGAKTINKLEKAHIDDAAKSFREISRLEKQLNNAAKGSTKYEKIYKELDAARKAHPEKIAKLGPLGARVKSLKDLDALKSLNKASRHSLRSANARDWLFHATRRNAARITKATEEIAALTFVLQLVGDFFDYTAASTSEFTNGIDIRPLGLLSADNMDDQDNVVNYGMWMMWSGDSTNPADDDAAYLQATDFAQKFYQDLVTVQDETNRYACDVDIFVVRPIIRNPGTPHQQIYWLFMNDTPWSTADGI